MADGSQKFTWTATRSAAAVRVAEDELRDEDIAAEAGVSRQALAKWKAHPDFQARVKEHIAELEASALKYAIAKKRNRVARQNADWLRLQRIREERAADPSMANVPGGETGLLVRQLKVIGVGQSAQTIEEYVLDTGLVKAESDLEKQASGEVGDDPPVKVRHGGDPDNPTPIKGESRITLYIPDNDRSGDDGDDEPADDDAADG